MVVLIAHAEWVKLCTLITTNSYTRGEPQVYSKNYQEFKKRWSGCTECNLHQHRKNIVLCRGNLPCNILYIGEAPGNSENTLGQPFIGPAGKLLDHIISCVMDDLTHTELNNVFKGSYAMTNVVCCKPPKNENGEQQPPTKKQVESCSDRLEDFINLSNPQIIVNVGTVSKRHISLSLPRNYKCEFVDIMHPASVLRIQSEGHKRLEIQRCVSRILQQIENTYAIKKTTNY